MEIDESDYLDYRKEIDRLWENVGGFVGKL